MSLQYICQEQIDYLDPYNRYRVLRNLGVGHNSEVYLCDDSLTPDRLVAVKCVHDRDALSEIRTLTMLKHRNMPTFHEAFYARDTWHLVMEYIDGERLDAYRARHAGRVSLKDVQAIGIQLAACLDALHEKNRVYRNLQPSSILRERDGRVRLLGFSGFSTDDEEGTSTLYSAPEQRMHLSYIDRQVDVYALGVLLHELLTGHITIERDQYMDGKAEQVRLLCIQMAAEHIAQRPTMLEVLRELLRV